MVKKYSLLVFFIVILFSKNSFTIESALHEAELAKCLGILLTIQNNEFEPKFKITAKKIYDHYLDKLSRLEMGEMTKEMSERGAKLVLTLNNENKNNEIHNLLNSCLMTFRVGN